MPTTTFLPNLNKPRTTSHILAVLQVISELSLSLSLNLIMLTYIISFITYFRWACELLFQQSFFSHRILEVAEIYEERSVVFRCDRLNSNEGDEECAVCLCKIEQGEEITELRCDHLFHKACLDRWVAYGRLTCPLCRDSLASVPPIIESGMRILTFKKFSSFTAPERESWWLR